MNTIAHKGGKAVPMSQQLLQHLWSATRAVPMSAMQLASRHLATNGTPSQPSPSGSAGPSGGAEAEVVTRAEAGGAVEESPEALEARKRRSLQSYLDQQLGGGSASSASSDRSLLAALLQRHGVVVRGGQQQAVELMEALQAWKRGEWVAPDKPQ